MMMNAQALEKAIDIFPQLDMSWPEPIQDMWWSCFWLLVERVREIECPASPPPHGDGGEGG